jgi:hypothetical protein
MIKSVKQNAKNGDGMLRVGCYGVKGLHASFMWRKD